MNLQQAMYVMKIMSSLFPNVPFKSGDKESMEIYTKQLIMLDHLETEEAVYELVKVNKFCPTLAEIIERYNQIKLNKKADKQLEDRGICPVCNNSGFIVFEKTIGGEYCLGDEPIPATFIAYCEKCPRGNDFKYDGRNIEKNKSNYYTRSISEYKLNQIPQKARVEEEKPKTDPRLLNAIGNLKSKFGHK